MVDETAKTEAVNSALIACGKEMVPDLSDQSLQSSIAARKIVAVLPRAKKTILMKFGWTCALEYTTIQPSVIPNLPPNRRYRTTFLMPGDFLRAWEVQGVPCQWDEANKCWPPFTWEPRWQLGTTEVNGSTQKFIRASAGPGLGLIGDDFGSASADLGDYGFPGAIGVQSLDPLIYVRDADWGSLDITVLDLVAYEAAARASYAITSNLQLQGKLDQYVAKKLLEAVGPDAGSEGGQPGPMPSIPQSIRALVR